MRRVGRAVWVAVLLALACAFSAPVAAQALKAELLLTEGELDGPPASAPVTARSAAEEPGDLV